MSKWIRTSIGIIGIACIGGGYSYYQIRKNEELNKASGGIGKTLTCTLQSRQQMTHDTDAFTFRIPNSESKIDIPIISHMLAIDNAMVYREYTPIPDSKLTTNDQFTLLVKMYPGGYFSNKFRALKKGDEMDFRGPVCTLEYNENVVEKIGLIAAGTGITPMYQLMWHILKNKNDSTKLYLLYANKTNSDILLKKELDELALQFPDRLFITYCIDDVRQDAIQDSNIHKGKINQELIQSTMPDPKDDNMAIIVCGPPSLLKYLSGSDVAKPARPLGGLMKTMGYLDNRVIRL